MKDVVCVLEKMDKCALHGLKGLLWNILGSFPQSSDRSKLFS